MIVKKSRTTRLSVLKNGSLPAVRKILSAVALLLLIPAVNIPAAAKEKLQNTDVVAIKPQSQPQLLAESIKPAVVRIIDGCVAKVYWSKNRKTYNVIAGASGSGYFVNPNGYIVTNAHVIELSQNKDKCLPFLFQDFVEQIAEETGRNAQDLLADDNFRKQVMAESRPLNYQPIHVVILPNGDKMPFNAIVSGATAPEGKDVAIVKINVRNAPVLKLASQKAELLQHVTVIGYPAAGESDLLNSESRYVPSITDGKISAKKYLKDGSPVLQISAPATHGSSGGPVVNDEGEVIGMVTFGGKKVQGQEVSGFSFIIPTNTIFEFVQQAGIVNYEGLVNQKYRQGLQLYSQKQYRPAMQKFQEVKRLFPQHSEVERYIENCQQAIAQL